MQNAQLRKHVKIRDHIEFTQPTSTTSVDINEGSCYCLLHSHGHCTYKNLHLFDSAHNPHLQPLKTHLMLSSDKLIPGASSVMQW